MTLEFTSSQTDTLTAKKLLEAVKKLGPPPTSTALDYYRYGGYDGSQALFERMKKFVARVQYQDVEFQVDMGIWPTPTIRTRYMAADSRQNKRWGPLEAIVATTPVPPYADRMTDEELTRWFFSAVIRPLVMHEAEEWFRVDNKVVYDPHVTPPPTPAESVNKATARAAAQLALMAKP